MDAAMDEFQEADILWPDTEDDELAPFAPMDTEELYEAAAGSVSSVAPVGVFGRRFEGLFLSGAGPDADDDEEWQEADVLWPDTADEPRRRGGLTSPFSGSSGRAGRRRVKQPATAWRDGWTTGPAASSPINIPANAARGVVGLRRR